MKTVELRYGVVWGKGDSSDWIDWSIELTDEEEKIYDHAIENEIPLNEIPELEGALRRAYEEIEDEEIRMGIDNEDEYTMECQGMAMVDPDKINDLIADRDPHALAFFGLEAADDAELDEWDANELDELPLIKDFVEGFEPYSPYDEGWTLNVEFVDPNEVYLPHPLLSFDNRGIHHGFNHYPCGEFEAIFKGLSLIERA